MTHIKRISYLRDCGIFRDFCWPNDLPDFGRFNLIYGWNGTGKTTLSRILRCLEIKSNPEGKVKIKIGDREVLGEQFSEVELPIQIRIFNRDFVNENVFPVGGGDLPPIFVLGEEDIEKQKEVERLKKQRRDAQDKIESARKAKKNAEQAFDQLCKDRARLIKETLRSSDRENRYNNYDKSYFHQDAESMAQAGDGSAYRLSDSDRDRLLMQLRATQKQKLPEVTYSLPDFDSILKRISELLATTVVSRTIEALMKDPDLADWTREGLKLHQDRNPDNCLFCEQPLPVERLKVLEAHFSTQYEQFFRELEQFIGELNGLLQTASELRLPHKAGFYDDLAEEFETAEQELNAALQATRAFLEDAKNALEGKKHRAFEQVSLELKPPQVDSEAVEKLNAVIRKHNQVCDDFQTRITEARKRLAEDMIAEALREFVSRRDALGVAEKELRAAQDEITRLDKEISRLEREIIEHRRPAEELNEDLQKYLGHTELQLQVKDTGYTITRGGVPAARLSEGEMTAIALLYFLKSLQDRQFDLTKGVVVLDDPVSSLDANALYLAFGFIRERTKEAGQLFIFTHNFSFFRQVRNWFHHLKGQNRREISGRPARFYMMDCTYENGRRSAKVRWLDPLLEKYNSEYHYLFSRIYQAANETDVNNLEENYLRPNMARRFLEAFLAFRQPAISGDLWKKMEAIPFDKAKKLRILRFLHTYSHGDVVGEPEHDPSILAEARSVLTDLLELIESQDKAHFDEMVRLVRSEIPEKEDE